MYRESGDDKQGSKSAYECLVLDAKQLLYLLLSGLLLTEHMTVLSPLQETLSPKMPPMYSGSGAPARAA